ncbi:hypothetical protein ABPG74_018720 [Tetrahymena malaccensis]
MIRLKKDKLFFNLLKLDRQQLIEQQVISEDDFIFQQGNEEQLNIYLSLALLTSCNYLPAERVVDLMIDIIEDNFVLDKIDIIELIKIIRQVGEFSLHDQDLVYVELVIQMLFSKNKNQLYQSSLILPSITLKKAKQKALDLIDKMHAHLEKYNQIQELNSNSQTGLQNNNGSTISQSMIQKKQKNFLSFNFKIYQKQKQSDDNQSQEVFPQILDGIFQRKVVLQLFPDENQRLTRFPNKIEINSEQKPREIQLPAAFRNYMNNRIGQQPTNQIGDVRGGNQVNENQEANVNQEENKQNAEQEESNNQQISNNKDMQNIAEQNSQGLIRQQPQINNSLSQLQNGVQKGIEEKEEEEKKENSIQVQKIQEPPIQILNSQSQQQQAINNKQEEKEEEQKQNQQNNKALNNVLENLKLNHQQSQEKKENNIFQEQLKEQLPNGGILFPFKESINEKLPNNRDVFPLKDLEEQDLKLKLKSASQKRQEKQQQPVSSQESVNLRQKYQRLQIFDIDDSQIQQNLNCIDKLWKPIHLIDCLSYFQKQEQLEEQLENQLNINIQEFNQVLRQMWDNIYDVCFKAIYFSKLINAQQTEELKSYCEYFILKNYIFYRQKNQRELFQNCQNMVYVAVLLLQYFNNETFYKIFIGAILNKLENLIVHQAYEFNYSKLNPYYQELFLVFQMLLLFDNPQYFQVLFNNRNRFILRFMNIYMKACYNIETNIKNELDIFFKFQLPNEQNQFQKILCDDYFNLILHNEHDELAYYLLTVQVICNIQSIIEVEQVILKNNQIHDQKIDQQEQDDRIPTWTEQMVQIQSAYGEIYNSRNGQTLGNIDCIPNIPNISLVNLQAQLAQKIIYSQKQFLQDAFFQNLKSLKLYQTNRCPNFSLNFIPPDIFGQDMRNKLFEVVEILKIGKKGNKQQLEEYKNEALTLYQKYFGLNTNLMIDKLPNLNDRYQCEEVKVRYFPVIFYEYYEQIWQKEIEAESETIGK